MNQLRRGYARAVLCVLCAICSAVQPAKPIDEALVSQKQASDQSTPTSAKASVDLSVFGAEPLSFEANCGQVRGSAQFLARTRRSIFLLQSDGLVARFAKHIPPAIERNHIHPAARANSIKTVVLRFSGANKTSALVGTKKLQAITNYYPSPSRKTRPAEKPAVALIRKNEAKRSDGSRKIENVPNFQFVMERNLYPGIDLVYHGNGGELEYDFIVAADARPDQIHLKFSGVEHITISREGDLVLHTAAGELIQRRPNVYERTIHGDHEVSAGYVLLTQDEVAFRLKRENPGSALIIDPVLNYSTYFGTTADENAKGVGVDSAGNAYIAGTSTVNSNNNSIDSGFVTKYSSKGAKLFTTYIGDGTCSTDIYAIAVDGTGNSYVTGFTQPNSGGCGNDHVLAAKLNSTGTLVYGEYFPGGGDQGNAIAVDSSGTAYITGAETSSSLFFTTPGAFMTSTTNWIAFVSKLDSGGNFLYSTFLGGTGTGDGGNGIAIDTAGNAYVTGTAISQDFPLKNAYQTTPDAFETPNAFFTVLNAAGSALIYSTYLAGTKGEGNGDAGNAVAIDSAGNAYIAGETTSPDFPVTAGAFDTQCGTDGLCNPTDVCDINGCQLVPLPDAFVAKINPNLSGAASLLYSTFIGGESYDKAYGVAVDRFGQAYVTGYTISISFPVVNSLQNLLGQNAFLTKVNAAGNGLIYSTYFGGSGTDTANGIALDSGGNIIIAGGTTSADFPVKNAAQATNGGGTDSFVAKFGFHYVPGDFVGDGRADIAVFRPSTGFWYVIPGGTQNTFIARQWGAQGDLPVRGDFDGDGQTDFGVFRPSNGFWYIIPSSNPNSIISKEWGTSGDIPVPGDYDGDGKTDFAVFRNGTWYIVPSSNPNSIITEAWGTSGDIPVPGDYDGDGKTDFAVFRPSDGTWYVIPSSNPNSIIVKAWGTSGDKPVPADYDGDGKTDFAVFRPATGIWYVVPSSNPNAPITTPWGTFGDVPVPADYDGDGIADYAVWRPGNGTWYILPSSSPKNITATPWGASTDTPVQKPAGQ